MESRVLSFRYQDAVEQRLDRFLAAVAPEYSRARLQALIKKDLVFVNGLAAKKAGQMIGPGTIVEVRVPRPRRPACWPRTFPWTSSLRILTCSW